MTAVTSSGVVSGRPVFTGDGGWQDLRLAVQPRQIPFPFRRDIESILLTISTCRLPSGARSLVAVVGTRNDSEGSSKPLCPVTPVVVYPIVLVVYSYTTVSIRYCYNRLYCIHHPCRENAKKARADDPWRGKDSSPQTPRKHVRVRLRGVGECEEALLRQKVARSPPDGCGTEEPPGWVAG